MYTFIASIILLIVGYIVYGRVVERVFGVDVNRKTPALTNPDGVDYVPLPWWRVFLIQFLNIAGLGPIFGAIMGAMYGPSAFLWIVFGSIFAGGVHDYFSGMLSLRHNGASLPEFVGAELGNHVKRFMRVFSLVLLVLLATVFISGPADILNGLVPSVSTTWWIVMVFSYFILATLLPIDKVIGHVYPLFGAALLFMALGIMVVMFINGAPIPEVTDGLASRHPKGYPLFPMMFVSIACGAISGFHATQSPLMARCIQNEKYGRRCFYGAMIAEGVVALIWAAAASSFWGSVDGFTHFMSEHNNSAAVVVNTISQNWLGIVGGILAVLGVVAAPITSGDTALRSARLIVADFMHINQKRIINRLAIGLPLFLICFCLLQVDFSIIWRYFAWCNQTLAVFTLWAITVWLAREKKCYWISLIPALFMTAVCSCYIFVAPEGFNLPLWTGYLAAGIVCTLFIGLFSRFFIKLQKSK
ncbi:MAG: carbon starvation protein A [Sphingobacteriia bacterium]|jgi:carbon starvation protein CstA|nr:carbon starvation CstA family protein [Paludibacteraceae bacterium]NCA79244.1 carbon starvation protein A [Sphingobacteriia bacterium]